MEDALRAKTRGNRSPEGVIFYDTIGYCKFQYIAVNFGIIYG